MPLPEREAFVFAIDALEHLGHQTAPADCRDHVAVLRHILGGKRYLSRPVREAVASSVGALEQIVERGGAP